MVIERTRIIEGGLVPSMWGWRVSGFHGLPDLRHQMETALRRISPDVDIDAKQFLEEQMDAYQARMEHINAALPRLYGDMLRDARRRLQTDPDDAIARAVEIRSYCRHSIEAREIEDLAHFEKGDHPAQDLCREMMASKAGERQSIQERFRDVFKTSTFAVRTRILMMLIGVYDQGNTAQRSSALWLLEATCMFEHDEEHQQKIGELILDGLHDQDGNVRERGYRCVEAVRFADPVNIFFAIDDALQDEKNGAVQRTLARSILRFACIIQDELMVENGLITEYRRAMTQAQEVLRNKDQYYPSRIRETARNVLRRRRKSEARNDSKGTSR